MDFLLSALPAFYGKNKFELFSLFPVCVSRTTEKVFKLLPCLCRFRIVFSSESCHSMIISLLKIGIHVPAEASFWILLIYLFHLFWGLLLIFRPGNPLHANSGWIQFSGLYHPAGISMLDHIRHVNLHLVVNLILLSSLIAARTAASCLTFSALHDKIN